MRGSAICGSDEDKQIPEKETNDIQSLQRGVYAARPIKKGAALTPADVYFAMPCQEGQTTSGQFGAYRARFVATRDYAPDACITETGQEDSYSVFRNYIHLATEEVISSE